MHQRSIIWEINLWKNRMQFNTLKDLLTKQEQYLYDTIVRPHHTMVLKKALDKKLKEDPAYEVFVPLEYHRYIPSVPKGYDTIIFKESFLISNKGRCYSINKKGKFISSHITKNGYPSIKSFRIHRLIGCLFVPLPARLVNQDKCYLHVNHMDGDKENYGLNNLEWVTPTENNDHAVENDLIPTTWIKGTIIKGQYKGYEFCLKGTKDIKRSGFRPESVYRTMTGEYSNQCGCHFVKVTKEECVSLPRGLDERIQKVIKAINYRVKSPIKGTNVKTGKTILIGGGEPEIRKLGFLPSGVSMSISGSQPIHKGYKFERVPF